MFILLHEKEIHMTTSDIENYGLLLFSWNWMLTYPFNIDDDTFQVYILYKPGIKKEVKWIVKLTDEIYTCDKW
jgi:hypothetical protein